LKIIYSYEKQRQSLHDSRRFGTLFQIFLWYYPGSGDGDCSVDLGGPAHVAKTTGGVRTKELFRLGEELHTSWDAWEMRTRVGEWMHSKVGEMLEKKTSNLAEMMSLQEQLERCSTALPTMMKASTATCAPAKAAAAAGLPIDDASNTACSQSQKELVDFMNECRSLLAQQETEDETRSVPVNSVAGADAAAAVRKLVGTFGEMRWEDEPKELERCIKQASLEYRGMELPPGTQNTINTNCAVKMGRNWPGGRVELNIHNHCDKPVHVWQGSGLHFNPPVMTQRREILAAGSGQRFTSHEHEVWGLTSGNGKVLLEWAVDVSNGAVQDFVLRDCPETKSATHRRG
jgi:hypothetical protein